MTTRSVVIRYVADTRQAQAATTALAGANTRLATQSTAATAGTAGVGQASRRAAGGLGLMSPKLLGAAGVVAGLRSAYSASSSFEESAVRLRSQIGLTAGEADQLAQAARSVGTETGRGAQEAVDASFFIASAGLRGSDAMDALERSAQAARIGLGETAGVADLVTSAMNAYGPETLDASAATDTLVAAVREGKAEASELAGSMGRVLPIASEMGVTFDEVGAATAAMTRTGSDAGTSARQLRQILMGILDPSQEAARHLEDLGMSSESLRQTIQEDGLWQALSDLRGAVDGSDKEMTDLFTNTLAVSGVMDLTGSNAAETAQIFENMADSTGVLEEAIGDVEGTTADKAARMSAAWEELKIQAGDRAIPAIGWALEDLTKSLDDTSDGMSVMRAVTSPLTGDFTDLNDVISDGIERMFGMGDAADDQEAAMRGLAVTGERYAGQAAAAAGATGELDDAMGDLEDQTASTADQLDIINEAFRVLAGVNLDAESAALRVKDGFDDLTDTLEDNGATLDDNTSKGRDNRQAIIDQAEAIWDEIGARHEQGDSLQDIIGTYDDHISTLYDSMIQAGLSEEEAANYIETLGLTPEDLYTEISANWEGARTEWQRVADAIGRIPTNVTTTHTTHLRQVSTPGSNVTARAKGGPVLPGEPFLVTDNGTVSKVAT